MVKIAKKQQITIGLDLDDTIVDHDKNRRVISLKLKLPGTDPQVKKIIYAEISVNSPAIKNSLEIINNWLNRGIKIYIVSRRKEDGHKPGRQWLKKYLPQIKPANIIFAQKDEDKSLWCLKKKIDIFIDDSPEVLDNIGDKTKKIIFDRKKIYSQKKFVAARSWKAIDKIVAKQIL